MRTTIQINEALLVDVKKLAAESGKTISEVIEDSLREVLARRKSSKISRKVRLTTFPGNGLRPGVDLDDSASLLDLMEEPDATR